MTQALDVIAREMYGVRKFLDRHKSSYDYVSHVSHVSCESCRGFIYNLLSVLIRWMACGLGQGTELSRRAQSKL